MKDFNDQMVLVYSPMIISAAAVLSIKELDSEIMPGIETVNLTVSTGNEVVVANFELVLKDIAAKDYSSKN